MNFPTYLFPKFSPALPPPITQFKQLISEQRQELSEKFKQKVPIKLLLQEWTHFIDELLINLWNQSGLANRNLTLCAVGGYGRVELFPRSDIDLLVLVTNGLTDDLATQLSTLITFTWDIGLELGHSVRTIEECVELGKQDTSITTSLLEARYLIGAVGLFKKLETILNNNTLNLLENYYNLKIAEQEQRHLKHHDTAYHLEPNIKTSPGGLRDIHTIFWIAKRCFQIKEFHELISRNILTESEYKVLSAAQHYLWQIRFALHNFAGKREDRLLFDFQKKLAIEFGFEDETHSLAIEQFMRSYFRAAREISDLNELTIQLLKKTIFGYARNQISQRITENFQIVNQALSVNSPHAFVNNPALLIEMFLVFAKNKQIKSIDAFTIRLLREYNYLIDNSFRSHSVHQKLFIAIFKEKNRIAETLTLMHRYGILGKYIPTFDDVKSQMQYDLFHAYTVDQHILFLITQLQSFNKESATKEFSFCVQLMREFENPEWIYLGAFFHDIGKGRGGDHSTLGATLAREFCQAHHLTEEGVELVGWLVQEHLLLSYTAQRKNIADPQVIIEFIKKVKSQKHLDALYLLTIADIRATNEKLWNGWKHSLLTELYHHAKNALAQTPRVQKETIRSKRNTLYQKLIAEHFSSKKILNLWYQLGKIYLLNHTEQEIYWHAQGILNHSATDKPFVMLKTHAEKNATYIVIYAHEQTHLFANCVAILDQFKLNIVDAKIFTAKNNFCINSFHVLTLNGLPIADNDQLNRIHKKLYRSIVSGEMNTVKPRIDRKLQHFAIKTQLDFYHDLNQSRTIMEISTLDRPGLLARLGQAFFENKIKVHYAKVVTLGERVEDIFYLTNELGLPIPAEQESTLRKRIIELIDHHMV